ncbi:hypothetical protein M422DRAFT_59921 [Sphaerobolus stellatus SS14]|uniref:Glycine cleavage system H protein n=1 Tax=Sphaerobolus stellatus (strain SS14) TaxID=990650 RepID=A0A0C9W0X5_SPHS4|nr:hypothetical protein M422DRAFT_59921 [Sphaerobolus stellatus SS14]
MLSAFRLAARSSPLLRSGAGIRPTLKTLPLRSSVRTVATKRFTKEHELLSFDDATSVGRLHITEHAAESLGDVVFVELPAVGREIEKGESIGAVESVKAASDIYAPVSGTITKINEALNDRAGLMSSAPEGDGWLCEIEVKDPSEVESLLDEEAYKTFCEEDH